ncbi:DUF3887 domain-containing protein [Spirosoma fluminis]
MIRIAFGVVLTLLVVSASAQTQSAEAIKLDSLAKLSQRFMNTNQPDSLYALMGPGFRQQISLEKTKEVMAQLTSQLGKWVSLESRGMEGGIARYKATFALAALDFYVSQNKEGKIETFLFKPLE